LAKKRGERGQKEPIIGSRTLTFGIRDVGRTLLLQ
jgi:hypothetical protein